MEEEEEEAARIIEDEKKKEEEERLKKIEQEKQEKQDRIDEQHEEMKQLKFWDWIEVFAYVFNLWLVAVPWTIFGFLMVLVNIFFNIDYNKGWAEGNVFLMFNTIYALIQYTLTIPLIYEVQAWLKHAKFIRLISLAWALFYNTVYVAFAVKFWQIIKQFEANKLVDEDITYFELFVAMGIVYNLIIHLPIIPMNLIIIVKEFSMEFY